MLNAGVLLAEPRDSTVRNGYRTRTLPLSLHGEWRNHPGEIRIRRSDLQGGEGKHPIDMSASSIYPLFANLKLLKLFFSSALPFTCLLDWFQRDPASVSSSYFPFLFPKDFKDPPRDRIDRHRYPSTIARGGVARFVFSIAD